MDTLLKDIRYSIRMLRKEPVFTALAVLILALGIGANTAIFSIVNAVLLNPLPYKDPERITMVWVNNSRAGVDQDYHSFPNFVDYKEKNHSFEEIAGFFD